MDDSRELTGRKEMEPLSSGDDASEPEPPAFLKGGPEGAWEEEEEPHPAILRHAALVEVEDEMQGELPLPRQPRRLPEVGLSKAFLADLALKIIHYSGTPSLAQLMRRLGLAQSIVQELLTSLTDDRLCETISQSDLYTGNFRYRLSERGIRRVMEALERTRYAGPAPVTAEQYSEVMRRLQSFRQLVTRERIDAALRDLVLSPEVADAVARALYSGESTLLYGPSGNGKTSILERFVRNVGGVVPIPYAIYAYGQVIRVFDPSIHEPVEELETRNLLRDDGKMDRRWVLIRRPAVILGTEIGPESLDVAYDPMSRFYQAPPHIKAQGGVLVVDDFGRQRIAARDLLTRWLIPMERGWDTLSLATGEKVTIPFQVQLLLATNLPIRQLADEALLRRILYKVEVPSPTPKEFAEILRRLCRQREVVAREGAIEDVVQRLYQHPHIKPRAALARDLVAMVIESAHYDGRQPVLEAETVAKVLKMIIS